MVDGPSLTVGLDRAGDRVFVAEVVNGTEHGGIVALREMSVEDLASSNGAVPQSVAVALPDHHVVTKSLVRPPAGQVSVADHCQFEMEHSLLDSSNEFSFDYYDSSGSSRVLAFAARRSRITDWVNALAPDDAGFDPSRLTCRSRALALGLGFQHYGIPESGQVVCLTDVGHQVVSICLMYQGQVAALSHVGIEECDLSTFDGRHRLAVELKTVIGFLIDSLREVGVTVPLSTVLVGGPGLRQEATEVLESYFPVGVRRPRINTRFLANSEDFRDIMHEHYMVALGLTVP